MTQPPTNPVGVVSFTLKVEKDEEVKVFYSGQEINEERVYFVIVKEKPFWKRTEWLAGGSLFTFLAGLLGFVAKLKGWVGGKT